MRQAFFAFLFVAAVGCDHPVQQQAQAIDVAAVTIATAAHVVADAAEADARSTCPEGSEPSCLDAVQARWEPVDAAFGGMRAALGAWLLADRVAMQTNQPIDAAEILRDVAEIARLYEEVRAALATAHVELPPLPALVRALLPATTSGGE
jgi:hypothetical protein